MSGLGKQLRGSGLAKSGFKSKYDVVSHERKRYAEGSKPEKIEIGEGKIGEPVVVTPEEMDKLLNPPEVKIPKIPSDKEISGVSKSVEDFKKKEKEEPKFQSRCGNKNKEGLQFRCGNKKGGMIKKGKK